MLGTCSLGRQEGVPVASMAPCLSQSASAALQYQNFLGLLHCTIDDAQLNDFKQWMQELHRLMTSHGQAMLQECAYTQHRWELLHAGALLIPFAQYPCNPDNKILLRMVILPAVWAAETAGT